MDAILLSLQSAVLITIHAYCAGESQLFMHSKKGLGRIRLLR
jgi:hypothetical protein